MYKKTILLLYLLTMILIGANAQVKGDANNDGTVNVSDVIAVSQYLQNSNSVTINTALADVNGDNQVTADDLVGIVKIILSGGYEPDPSHYFMFYASDPYEVSAYGTGSMEEYSYVGTDISGWTCRSNQDWCRVRNDDQCVYFRVSPHERYKDREAVITASYEGKDYATLTIKQRAKIFFYFNYPDGKAMPVNGGSIVVKVYTNSTWWTVSTFDDSWVKATKTDDNTITLTASAREGTTPRESQEIFIMGEDRATFTVTDGGKTGNEGYHYDDNTTPWD